MLNGTIDRYAYAHVTTRKDDRIVFRADDLATEESLPCSLDFDSAKASAFTARSTGT